MIDFLGQEVKVGDYVVFNVSGKGLTFGVVEKITLKQVKVVYAMTWSRFIDTVNKAHDTVQKVTADTPQVATAKKKLQFAIMQKVKQDLTRVPTPVPF